MSVRELLTPGDWVTKECAGVKGEGRNTRGQCAVVDAQTYSCLLADPALDSQPPFPGIYAPNLTWSAHLTDLSPLSFDTLAERLRELHGRTQETPLFNPVFQLAHDVSRALEAGEVSLDDISGLIGELETRSLEARADRASRKA